MENNTISSCRCPCFSCIVQTSLKYEEAKNYNKSYQLFNESIKFLENSLRKVEEAKEAFLSRVRMLNIKLDDISIMEEEKENLQHSDTCESLMKKTDKCKKKEKARVPVAVFDEDSDPNKKAMYPKHLVYANGEDIQLEEIRAMNYWKKIKSEAQVRKAKSALINKSIQTDPQIVATIRENFTQTETRNSIIEKASQTELKAVTEKASQTESLNPERIESKVEDKFESLAIKHLGEKVQNIPHIASKVIQHHDKIETDHKTISSETFVKSKPKLQTIDVQEDVENILYPMDFLKDDEHDESLTCTTKNFKVLCSSTPFHSNNKRTKHHDEETLTNISFGRELLNKNESLTNVRSNANLSMILELSKERFSQSTSSGKHSAVSSKTYCVSEFKNISEKEEDSNSHVNLKSVTNPFEDSLINYFLQRVAFPNNVHLPGYSVSSSEMPNARPLSSIKLGGEKFNVSGEIGKGAYARILKIHPESKSSKSMALKQQKPACLWEWYINKEISHRLNDPEKEKFFMQYTKMYVFKNGSLMLSDWARFGTILNLMNNLKSMKNTADRCPMGVCAYLSVQLISSIEYLHSCQIIHGDVKPDNFVLTAVPSSTLLQIKLIDYGRCIDMRMFPANKIFTHVVTTDDFTCNEMKEKKPWSYQIDLYGLAGTMYILLMGDYMKTEKKGDLWVVKRSLLRYLSPEVWNPILETLLNVPSSSRLPDLTKLRKRLEEQLLNKMDKYNVQQQITSVYNILNKK